MCPDFEILGMDLYSILLVVGVIAAMAILRILSDKRGFTARWQNFCLCLTVAAVILGYGASVVFQGLYNIAEIGHFELTNSTGATFYGGLIGGAATFLIGYFAVGHFLFRDGYHLRRFRSLLSIAACSITGAHAFGRLGCLTAGCCYGARTDAWYGITMQHLGYKVIPTQLFESVFLFILCALLIVLFLRRFPYGMPVYMMSYAVWRFLIEYLRDDYRGTTLVSFLTPSQLIAVIMFVGGIGVLIWELLAEKKAPQADVDDRDAEEVRAAREASDADVPAADDPEEAQ